MAMRIQNRRYGRENEVVASATATHIIKIGVNSGKSGEVAPRKLNGFCIYRDALGDGNRPMVDYDAMASLGYKKDSVDAAIKGGFNADPALLPQMLHFMLMSDAKRGDGGWDYDGIYGESYESYGKLGLFCYGNGESAIRKQQDGTKARIECNPVGKTGCAAEDFCPFSASPDKLCKLHYRVNVLLYTMDEQGAIKLVSPLLGAQARYRFDSTSEYGSGEVGKQLDAAADRVEGRLNQLTGIMLFNKRARRTGNDKFSKAIVGHVTFKIDEESIRSREREIYEAKQRLFDQRLLTVNSARAIEPPAPPSVSDAEVVVMKKQYHAGVELKANPQTYAPRGDDTIQQKNEEPIDAEIDQDSKQSDELAATLDERPDDAEPGEQVVRVADATDDELIEALGVCVHLTARDQKLDPGVALKRLTACDFDGKRHPGVRKMTYFTEGEGEVDQMRRRFLRHVCAGLEASGTPHFDVVRAVS